MSFNAVLIFVTYNLNSEQFVWLSKFWNKVIIVNNGKLLLTVNNLRGPKVIWNETNLGYGGGANEGIRKAIRQGVEWVVVMNQDLNITKDGMVAFEKALQKSPSGIAGPFAGGFDNKRWTTIIPSKQVDYISGACMAIHRKVIEKVGLFYVPYFMYYEDADYCVRAKKAGFPLIHMPISGILHEDRPSLGKGSFLHEYYLARNHELFVERMAPLHVKSYEYLHLPKTLIEHMVRKNFGALTGIMDYFMRRFGEKYV